MSWRWRLLRCWRRVRGFSAVFSSEPGGPLILADFSWTWACGDDRFCKSQMSNSWFSASPTDRHPPQYHLSDRPFAHQRAVAQPARHRDPAYAIIAILPARNCFGLASEPSKRAGQPGLRVMVGVVNSSQGPKENIHRGRAQVGQRGPHARRQRMQGKARGAESQQAHCHVK
jgi:hypothetical protein